MSAIKVGDSRRSVLVDGLHRGQIVQYAGASGDFNPLHSDEPFATGVAGYPTVIAHGMLTMGMGGRLVSDWFGNANILFYGARLKSSVLPGDTLTGTASVVEIIDGDDNRARIEISLVNQRGEISLTGEAIVRLTDR